MPETKKKIRLLGRDVDVTEVPIVKSEEPFCEYELEDGSKIRVKHVVTSFVRIDGEFAPDGRPLYLVFAGPVVTVLSSPDDLIQPPRNPAVH
jgi:hypothetical protein